jgi:hypothetical protein
MNIYKQIPYAVILFFLIQVNSKFIAQQAPPLPDGVNKLFAFIGNWEGEAKMTMDGKTSSQKVEHKIIKLPNGWGLQIMETGTSQGMTPYEAIDLFGYDPGEDQYHLYTISNYADTHDHKGHWIDKTLDLQYEGLQDGKPMVEKLSITLDNPSSYHFNDNVTVDGKQIFTMECVMNKK